MKVFEDGNLCLLPLYYNMISASEEYTFGMQALDTTCISGIIAALMGCKEKQQILAIDMQFISVFSSKTNRENGILEILREFMNEFDFIIYNIQKSPDVLEVILSDLLIGEDKVKYYDMTTLEKISKKTDEVNWGAYISSNNKVDEMDSALLKKLWFIYTKRISVLICEKCIDRRVQYLPSSDVYSSTYVRIKDLFLFPEHLSLCIFLLCKLVKDNFFHTKIDGIISMSNTGAILANLVGKMLGKDVIFCTNVGPKFALDLHDVNKTIVKGNNYLFIFDFLCLGTEIKNLKSILICLDANTIGGVGIASLPNLDNLRNQPAGSPENNSILAKAYSLITLKDHGIDYNISTTKSELEVANNAAN